jgi:hypothetical protein
MHRAPSISAFFEEMGGIPRYKSKGQDHSPGCDLIQRPAHRDKAAMNGAQLLMAQDDFDDRATCLRTLQY